MELLLALFLGQSAGYGVSQRHRLPVRLLASYAALFLSHDISRQPILLVAPFLPSFAYALATNFTRKRHAAVAEVVYAAAVIATTALFNQMVLPILSTALQALGTTRSLFTITVYLTTIFGGGLLVKAATRSFLSQLEADNVSLPQAGLWIGWSERFLVLTFVLSSSYEPIGYLLAAKTAARFPSIKDERKLAEYYLIGTLASLAIAVLGGALWRRVIAALP